MYLESYKNLKVWQKSIGLVKEVYKLTEKFPKAELYGLTSQMRRCAVSVPSNIAEGYKRKNIGEYIQFLSIADASAAELETQIIISKEIYSNIEITRIGNLLEEIQKMLTVLIRKLKEKSYSLTPNPSTLYPKNGFTIIELLVAMSLFVIIVTIAVGSFISAMRTQRVLVALMAVNDNASLVIEQMAKEIRTGTGFPMSGVTCSNLDNLTFTNSQGNAIKYGYKNGSLVKDDGTSLQVPITASNVNVKKLNFCVLNRVGSNPARVTILLEVAVSSTSAIGVQGVSTNLQTTISARNLE